MGGNEKPTFNRIGVLILHFMIPLLQLGISRLLQSQCLTLT
jgi:hypothetical protein